MSDLEERVDRCRQLPHTLPLDCSRPPGATDLEATERRQLPRAGCAAGASSCPGRRGTPAAGYRASCGSSPA